MIVNKPKKKKKLSRYTVLQLVMGIIFATIVVKLLYLQVLRRDEYKERANRTATRFMSEKAPRGNILDSTGNILATNKSVFTLTYTQTKEADREFFTTIDQIYKILDENNEKINDTMLLKIDSNGNPFFEYKNSTKENQNAEELRFKKDRGMDDAIRKELFPKKSKDELTEDENKQINERLLAIDAKETFNYLVKFYNLVAILNPEPDSNDPNYKEKMEAYNNKNKELKDLDADSQVKLLLEKYTIDQIKGYMLIKDAIRMQSFNGDKFVTIASNISETTANTVYQKLNDLPGINVQKDPIRSYPYNELGSAILGYMTPISSTSKEKYEFRGYDASTDLIGAQGIEAAFEDQLKGGKGGTNVKVNSKGKVTEELFKLESNPGNNVHLTIDMKLQYATEQALKDAIIDVQTNRVDKGRKFPNATRGAAIVVEVDTGRILSLASYPNFNPNDFAIPGQLTPEQTKKYFNPDLEAFGNDLIKKLGLNVTVDDLFPLQADGSRIDRYDLYAKPFYNYATLGTLPPGSIFKPLTSVAGLEEGVITPSSIIVDRGEFKEHPDTFGSAFAPDCWIYTLRHGSHGSVNVEKALQVSCNYYYYETAYRLYKKYGGTPEQNIKALDSIAKYAWKFGLGVDPNGKQNPTTGIEIEENFGQVYNFESWKTNVIALSKFELRDYLESGNYRGIYSFVPFDYNYNEDDTEELKDAKNSLKKKIEDRLKQVGTIEDAMGHDKFAKYIEKDVKKIAELSNKYQKNLKNANKSQDEQVKLVVSTIARFTTNDKPSEITTPAQIVYSAIGQGMNNFTPIQLAGYISTLVNGGTRYNLHLVDKITAPDGEVVKEYNPQVLDKIDIKPENLAAIRRGMAAVNEADGGTASSVFRGFPIPTGGKTGTADFSEKQDQVGRAAYSTYVSFAPLDNPKIAFVGVIYDTGGGSDIAKVSKAVYEAYFKDEILAINPGYTSASFQKYVLGAPEEIK